jgi:hypothetical protein
MRGVAASETRAAQTGATEWPAGLCRAGVGRPARGRGSGPRRVSNRRRTRTPRGKRLFAVSTRLFVSLPEREVG